ncbi:MAG: single-stranded DNA-binding protein [Clostridia bacterium]|nr:single-stranded DNA-binding protein [Clostridia bacterium]
MLNKVILMGRLTRDPELRTTPQGVSVCTFSVAVDRGYVRQGEERQADFINVVAWRSTAEFVSKYFIKGQMIAVVGRLQTRNYDDKDGKKVYVTEVVADEISFADSKRDNGQASAPATYTTAAPAQAVPQQTQPPVSDGFQVVPDEDDLPF